MNSIAKDTNKSARVAWRRAALPAEHGGWGLVLEPIALGLLAAYSTAGAWLGLGAFLSYLTFHPLRMLLRGTRRGHAAARLRPARVWALIYGSLTLICTLIGLSQSGWLPLRALLLAAPLGLVYLRYDLEGPSRAWQAEVSAPLAFGSVVSGIALADGMNWEPALALWALMAARGLPAIAYVRARIRLDKGQVAQIGLVWLTHLAALLAVGLLVREGWLPNAAIAALLILLLRAALGLSPWRWEQRVRSIGIMEMIYGALVVLLVGLSGR